MQPANAHVPLTTIVPTTNPVVERGSHMVPCLVILVPCMSGSGCLMVLPSRVACFGTDHCGGVDEMIWSVASAAKGVSEVLGAQVHPSYSYAVLYS